MDRRLNILYHTNFSGNLNAGPTYSVPNQVRAQAEIDNVMWLNLIDSGVKEWKQTNLFYTATQFNFKSLKDLPKPFNNPDIVVFESFYQPNDLTFSKELKERNIPYVIVPRGALTTEAQRIKRLKKIIGNFFLFSKFAKNASGIQFLTEKEKKDSGDKWNKNSFVIPNGINLPDEVRTDFSHDIITFTYIGRLAIRHKGLDLLIDAIEMTADLLRKHKCQFNLYGSDESGSREILKSLIVRKKLDDLVHVFESVHGNEKKNVLLKTDIFVLTSRFEGHPMALIEALSYGVPALVTTGTNMYCEICKFDAGWGTDCSAVNISKTLQELLLDFNKIYDKSGNSLNLAQSYQWNKLAMLSHEKFLDILYKLDDKHMQ